MKFRNVLTVYLKEMRDTLRDRRALLSIVIIPTLVMPLLMFSVGKIAASVTSKAHDEVSAVVVLGGEDSPGVIASLQQVKKIRRVPGGPDWKRQIADKQIRAAVNIPEGFEAGLNAGLAPAVTIYNYDGELKSSLAVDELERFFRELRERTVAARLAERALPATLVKPFELKRENVAPPEKVGGNLFGGFIPYMVILLCFTGAMYPAIDLTAGEKERGTMETLLCSPVARLEIVLGKFVTVFTGAIAAMFFMLLSMGGTAFFLGALYLGNGDRKQLAAVAGKTGAMMPAIDPLGMVGVLAMVLPVAVLFSAVLMSVALFAKSYKEAQSYIAPLAIVVIMPVVIGILPGIELNAGLALVPLLNLSLICKELLSGVWHWDYIALIFGSTSVYAGLALAWCVRMFNREDVIFRT